VFGKKRRGRAVDDDGWIATCRHGRLPWENAGCCESDKDVWLLDKRDDGFSEAVSADEKFDTGEDTSSPVGDAYKAPFRFGE
jgi:hypothetical protein